MEIQVGTIINEEFIEKMCVDVEVEGYQEFQHTEHSAKHFSADGDENGTFWEAMQFATKDHYYLWKRDREYKDVTSKIGECIQHKLKEAGFMNRHENADPLVCGWGELFTPLRITEGHVKAVERCLYDAAFDVAWLQSESLQLFFQTENPCCWDGKPPKQRYGKDWIKDTETRLFLMHTDNLDSEVYDRLTRDNYKSVLRNTSGDAYEVLWNEEINDCIY